MSYKKFEKTVIIPSGVTVKFIDGYYYFSGSKGEIKHKLHKHLSVNLFSDSLCIFFKGENLRKRELSGILALINTTCSLFKNYMSGVLEFFSCSLILSGIGYKAKYDSSVSVLHLTLGFSHPIKIHIPKNIFIELPDTTNIVVKGVSKYEVGKIALQIREKRMPEIYKGNGIRYKDEIIKLKSPKKSK